MNEQNATGLAVVILAAGQGTRMKSSLPKVLHQLGGRSLLAHVLSTAIELEPDRVVVVVRHERDLVAAAALDALPGVQVVDQDDIPGTGRAAELAVDALDDFDGDVLVLSGDVPLLEAPVLAGFVTSHRLADAAVSVLSAQVDDPTGYGRIVRGAGGGLERIVEQKDASPDELSVREINTGIYVFRAA